MSEYIKSFYSIVGIEEEPERPKTALEEFEEYVCNLFPALPWKYRIPLVLILLALGALTSMISSTHLMRHDIRAFAITYTIGNIISLSSTLFLYGPCAQLKKMFAYTRVFSTLTYFFFLFFTLFLVLFISEFPLKILVILVAILLQFLSLAWYTLSYIPYGRDMAKTVIASIWNKVCCVPFPTCESCESCSLPYSTPPPPPPTNSTTSFFNIFSNVTTTQPQDDQKSLLSPLNSTTSSETSSTPSSTSKFMAWV